MGPSQTLPNGARVALRHAPMRRYLGSWLLANLGEQMLSVAVGWQVYALIPPCPRPRLRRPRTVRPRLRIVPARRSRGRPLPTLARRRCLWHHAGARCERTPPHRLVAHRERRPHLRRAVRTGRGPRLRWARARGARSGARPWRRAPQCRDLDIDRLAALDDSRSSPRRTPVRGRQCHARLRNQCLPSGGRRGAGCIGPVRGRPERRREPVTNGYLCRPSVRPSTPDPPRSTHARFCSPSSSAEPRPFYLSSRATYCTSAPRASGCSAVPPRSAPARWRWRWRTDLSRSTRVR